MRQVNQNKQSDRCLTVQQGSLLLDQKGVMTGVFDDLLNRIGINYKTNCFLNIQLCNQCKL